MVLIYSGSTVSLNVNAFYNGVTALLCGLLFLLCPPCVAMCLPCVAMCLPCVAMCLPCVAMCLPCVAVCADWLRRHVSILCFFWFCYVLCQNHWFWQKTNKCQVFCHFQSPLIRTLWKSGPRTTRKGVFSNRAAWGARTRGGPGLLEGDSGEVFSGFRVPSFGPYHKISLLWGPNGGHLKSTFLSTLR